MTKSDAKRALLRLSLFVAVVAAATAGAASGLGRGGVINYHLHHIRGHSLLPKRYRVGLPS